MFLFETPALYLFFPQTLCILFFYTGYRSFWEIALLFVLSFCFLLLFDIFSGFDLIVGNINFGVKFVCFLSVLSFIFCIVSFVGLSWFYKDIKLLKEKIGSVGDLKLYVVRVKQSFSGRISYYCRVLEPDFLKNKDICCYFRCGYLPVEGDIVSVKGKISLFKDGFVSNGGFNPFLYYASEGISFYVVPYKVSFLSHKESFIVKLRNFIRHKIAFITKTLTRRYLFTFLLGDTSLRLKQIHKKAGTMHLLAISGLHLGLVVAIFYFLPLPLWLRGFLILLFSFLYLTVSNFSPSIVRAFIFVAILCMSLFFYKPVNGLNSLFLAGSLMLAFNPFYLWSLSFRLSFSAVFGIIVVAGFILFFKSNMLRLFTYSFSAFWTTYPFVSFAFGSVPLVAIIVNPIAILIFTIAFYCSVLGFFLNFLSFNLADVVFFVSEKLYLLLHLVLSSLFGIFNISIYYNQGIVAGIIFLFLFLFLYTFKKPFGISFVVSFLSGVLYFLFSFY